MLKTIEITAPYPWRWEGDPYDLPSAKKDPKEAQRQLEVLRSWWTKLQEEYAPCLADYCATALDPETTEQGLCDAEMVLQYQQEDLKALTDDLLALEKVIAKQKRAEK